MRNDARRQLEETGRRPVPEVDPAFADELEARLRSVAAELPADLPAPAPTPRRAVAQVVGRQFAVASLGLAALAIVVGVVVSSRPPDASLELMAPVNVEVALADGTTLQDPDGFRLPDGAVVRVGTGGSARIGDMVLVSGDVATVTSGRVVVQHGPSIGQGSGSASTRTPRPTRVPAASATRPATPPPAPGRSPRPSAPFSPAPSATAPPGGPTPTPRPVTRTPEPATPRPSRTPTAATPTPSPSAPPSAEPTPSPKPTPAILRPKLRARAAGRVIVVTWTATLRARSYALIVTRSRSGPAAVPVYPGSPVFRRFADAPAKPFRFRVGPRIVEVRLLVVALRQNGTVLRRSRVVAVRLPVVAASGGSPPSSPDPSAPPGPSPSPGPPPSAPTPSPPPTTSPSPRASPP